MTAIPFLGPRPPSHSSPYPPHSPSSSAHSPHVCLQKVFRRSPLLFVTLPRPIGSFKRKPGQGVLVGAFRANGWIGGGIPRHRPGPLAFATAGLARRQHPRAPVSGPSSNSQHHQPAGSWSWKLRHPAHRHTAGRSIWTEEIRRGGRGRSDGGARASRCCHSTRS